MSEHHRYSFEELMSLGDVIPDDDVLEEYELPFADRPDLLALMEEQMTKEGFDTLAQAISNDELDRDWLITTLAIIQYLRQQPKN